MGLIISSNYTKERIMKKFISATLILICAMCSLVFTGCQKEYHYYIDDSSFNMVLALNDEIKTLENLYICKSRKNEVVKTSVTTSMIKSYDATDTVGTKNLILAYDGREFVVQFNVKYRVNFVVEDTVINSQLVLTPDEVEYPNNPTLEGVNFSSWTPVEPAQFTNNFTFTAQFALKDSDIPIVSKISATYGDKLSDLTLPSNAKGAWQFIKAPDTFVGDAGTNQFEIKFVPTDPDLVAPANRNVQIEVKKKKVEFSNVSKVFTYDGTEKTPSFDLSVADLKTKYFPEYAGMAVGAGKYDFEMRIDEENYEGKYVGSFEIQKMQAKIQIHNKTINFGDEVPEVYAYDVLDNTDVPLSSTLVELMDIKINKPTFNHAGTYTISAYANNQNFDVIVENGSLYVNKVELNLDDASPAFKNGANIIYGDMLSSLTIVTSDQRGTWSFVNDNQQVLTPNSFTTDMLFTPHETQDYLPSIKPFTLTVLQRTLQINVLQNIYTYDGTEHSLIYEVLGVLEQDKQPEVVGNVTKIQANPSGYFTTLVIDTDKYTAHTDATLTINKAKQADFTTIYPFVWNEDLKLQHITLNEGYAWVSPTTDINHIGEQTYDVVFTPNDTVNYEVERGLLKIDIAKANAEIRSESSYELTYKPYPHDYELTGIRSSHAESNLVYSYIYEGLPTNQLKDAGTYTVNLTLPESEHYFEATTSFGVIIKKVTNTDSTATLVNATYLDTLGEYSLPTSEFGEWAWEEGADCLVGNAGIAYHNAIFTPTDAKNYHSRIVEVTFNIAKKSVIAPTISAQTYTGAEMFPNIATNALYDFTLESNTEAGTYEVELTLTDSDNYCWINTQEESTVVNFEIKKYTNNNWLATNKPSVVGCTYKLGNVQVSEAKAEFGDVSVAYAKQETPTITSATIPTTAGKYIAIFTVAETTSYNGLEEIIKFEIAKQTVNVPTTTPKVYTGETLYSDVVESDLYEVLDLGRVNAGEYDIQLTLNDAANYCWSTSDEASVNVKFNINQADNSWESQPSVKNSNGKAEIIFGDTYSLTASSIFGEFDSKTVKFSVQGSTEEPTLILPQNVGNYTAHFEIVGNSNYKGLTKTVDFEILHKQIVCPEIDTAVYTGEKQQTTLENTATYTVTQSEVGTDVKGYDVVFVLTDKLNYIWASTENNDDITQTFHITQADNSWKSQPKVTNASDNEEITYGDALELTAISTFGSYNEENVKYSLQGSSEEPTSTKPKNAGKYTAHFFVQGNTNYKDLLTQINFEIQPQVVAAPEVSPVYYSGENQVANVKAVEGLYSVINLGGENVGSYDVIFTLEDYGNFIWSDKTAKETLTVSFVINKNPINNWTITPAVTNLENQEITFGDEIKTAGKATFGELKDIAYKLVDADDATITTTQPTDAGTYVAVFAVDGTDNYVGNEKRVTFTIKPKAITKPSISPKTYTGETLYADIDALEGIYKVTQQGGDVVIEQGYPVYVELLSNNYMWNGEKKDVRTITLWFKIIPNLSNKWTIEPDVTGFTYGDGGKVEIKAAAKYGEVDVVFINKAIANDNGTTTFPTNAGNYTAIFSVAETDNYSGLDEVKIDFSINPILITVPGETSAVYNGTSQKANVSDGEFYAVTKNEGHTDVGTYYVEYSILNEYYGNYVWSGNINSDVVSVKFEILKNEHNDWKTSSVPTITNSNNESTIVFGDIIKATAEATYFHTPVVVTYAVRGATEEPTKVVPTVVGEYTAYFFSEGNDNYNQVTGSVNFEIKPKPIGHEDLDSVVYTGENQQTALKNTTLYTVTQTEVGADVKGYDVVFSLVDKFNYVWLSTESNEDITGTFHITQAENSWLTSPSVVNTNGEEDIIFGDTLKIDYVPTFGNVEDVVIKYSHQNSEDEPTILKPSNVGEYTAYFFLEGNHNYKDLSQTVNFEIKPKAINCPEIDSAVYTGEEKTTTLQTTEIYLVTQTEVGTEVGGYEVVFRLLDAHNYIWSSTQTNTNIVQTFNITQANNTWQEEPTIVNALDIVYGDTVLFTLGKSDFGEATVTYLDLDKTEIAEPTEVGSYYIKFYVEGTKNYKSNIKEILFTINPKVVAKPTMEYSSVAYAEENQVPVEQTSNTERNDNLYSVEEAIGTEIGTYYATLTLVDAVNYCWERGNTSATTTIPFNITQADNEWVIAPSVSNALDKIYYGDEVNASATAKFGGAAKVTFTRDGSQTALSQPGNAGKYIVTFLVEETKNYKAISDSSITINVLPKRISVPTSKETDFIYNGSYQAPTDINDVLGDGYVANIPKDSVDARTYKVLFNLENEGEIINFVWADSLGTEQRELSYVINQAPNDWVGTPEIKGWDYTPNPTAPIIATKFGTAIIEYKLVGEDSYTTTLPKDAGSYVARAYVEETNNYAGLAPVENLTFTISKVNAFVTAPVYSGVYYENTISLEDDATTKAALIANYDEEVGTFTYHRWAEPIKTSVAADYVATEISVTYTPKNPETSNYVSNTYTDIKINIKLVAYLSHVVTNDDATTTTALTYYGMVEQALKDAQANDKVVVIPNVVANSTKEDMRKVTIATNTTIPEKVELILPYKDASNNLVTTVDGKATLSGVTNNTSYPYIAPGVGGLTLHTQLVIKSGVVLTNKGTISIAGELTGSMGGLGMAGNTARYYAKIELEKDAKIQSVGSSIINCCGLIGDTNYSNGTSQVEMAETSTLYIPIVIHDFRGGSYMTACYLGSWISTGWFSGYTFKYMPFNQWELRNITSLVKINSGASVNIYANLYADDTNNFTTANLIGTNTNDTTYFVNIASGGYITCKTQMTEDEFNKGDKWINGVMDLQFYGGATVNSLKLTILDKTINTTDFYFPLSWRHSLTFVTGAYTINNKYKMMPGATLTVESGATIGKIGELIIYNSYTDDCATGDPVCRYGYNRATGSVEDRGSAHVIVNGTLKGDVIAGTVKVGSSGTVTATTTSKKIYEVNSITAVAVTGKKEISLTLTKT